MGAGLTHPAGLSAPGRSPTDRRVDRQKSNRLEHQTVESRHAQARGAPVRVMQTSLLLLAAVANMLII